MKILNKRGLENVQLRISLCLTTMNEWFKSKEFLRYWWRAKSLHSIHSPFVFDFIQNVLHDHRRFYCYEEIEGLRQSLMESDEMILIHDPGAGSQFISSVH